MKILHISPEGTTEILGGRGIWLKKIIDIQKKDNDVRLVSITSDDSLLSPNPDGAIGWMYAVNMMTLGKTLSILKDWTPDVIHVHDCDTADACTYIKQAYPQIPMVLTIHLSATASLLEGLCQTEVQRYLMSREQNFIHVVDSVMVCSKYYADKFTDQIPTEEMPWYMTEKKPYIIPNGVDADFKEAGTELKNDKRNIFFAGRFAVGKGLETLCEVIPMMPDCRFILAGQFNGTAEERKTYQTTIAIDKAKALYPDQIVELGHIDHKDIGYWAKQCDVWVAPSWHCPFELVGLEAMACGVPLVCTKTGAFLEYGNELNCSMAEPNDAKSLQEAIEYACYYGSELIDGGKHTASQYTWEATNNNVMGMYERTMAVTSTRELVR